MRSLLIPAHASVAERPVADARARLWAAAAFGALGTAVVVTLLAVAAYALGRSELYASVLSLRTEASVTAAQCAALYRLNGSN